MRGSGLEGHRLSATLVLHLIFTLAPSSTIIGSWWLQYRARKKGSLVSARSLVLEYTGVFLLMITRHLGRFLSGANGAP